MNISVILAVALVAYLVAGNVLWTKWMISDEDGLGNPLVRAELLGCTSYSEAVAFWMIKGLALAVWPIGFATMQIIRIAHRPVAATSSEPAAVPSRR